MSSAVRRFRYENGKVVEVGKETVVETAKPIVSDALGFTESQHADFEADRVKHGFKSVEFVRDPDVPQFYQVKFGSQKEWARYVKHRGMVDRNSLNGSGASVTQADMDQMKARLLEQYPSRRAEK